VRWEDVEIDAAAPAVKFRREMEAQWKAQWGAQREAQFRGSHK
jgi:hypothetical protein